MKVKRKMKLGIKILIGIVLILVISGLSIAVWYSATVNSIKKELAPQEVVIGSGNNTALLIYQPSNADAVSSPTVSAKTAIAKTLADRGYKVTVNYPSKRLDYDLKNYDTIIFGSPVYSGNLSPVLKEYAESNPITGKNILIFVTGMYPEDEKELKDMKTWVDENNQVEAIKISEGENSRLTSFVTRALESWEEHSDSNVR